MIFNFFNTITFATPAFFLLLLILPVMIFHYFKKGINQTATLKVSSIKSFASLSSWKNIFRHMPFLLRIGSMFFIIIALARPQTKNEEINAEGEGIDIVLGIDVSGSMTAQDFSPNRMEAAKKVAEEFVDSRPTDRIGIVVFAGESFTQCPLTTDKQVLKSAIQHIQNGILEDGTAIGDGLSTSIDRLRNTKSKSKVIILLTDGENNGGIIGPASAKEIAKAFHVKVYTIGVGSEGYAPFPVNTQVGVIVQKQKVTIDEKLLNEIAIETGGKYFRAKDNAGLNNIYKEIDQLEKSKVEITTVIRYTEKYFIFVLLALILLLLEITLKFTVLKKIP